MLYISSSGAARYGERLAVALGFVTLLFALATFASCRSCLSFLSRFGLKNPVDLWWYRPFYRYHGYYWWGFLFGLLLHLMAAVMHTAIPALGDPDGLLHLIILSFGAVSPVAVGGGFSSCRWLVCVVPPFMEKGPLSSRKYQEFYRYHSWFWLILILVTAGHLIAGYVHVGFWPG